VGSEVAPRTRARSARSTGNPLLASREVVRSRSASASRSGGAVHSCIGNIPRTLNQAGTVEPRRDRAACRPVIPCQPFDAGDGDDEDEARGRDDCVRHLGSELLCIRAGASSTDLPPTYLNVIEDPYGDCYLIVLPDAKAGFGHVIKMWNSAIEPVTISQRDGFWTKTLPPNGENDSVRMHGSGTYLSSCIPGRSEAPIKVLPKAPAAPAKNAFQVTWADDAAPATWRFGVQYRVGQGVWRQWQSGTALRSAIFVGANGKTYFFRARTARTLVEKTDWGHPPGES
jgi:hypothetical protein